MAKTAEDAQNIDDFAYSCQFPPEIQWFLDGSVFCARNYWAWNMLLIA